MDSSTSSDATRERVQAAEHLEALLDEALKATFPASDPVALTVQPTKGKS
jgi:hypothetical protein